MNLREISDTSIVISLFRYFFKWYAHVKQKQTDIYHNSQVFSLAKECRKKVTVYFRYSILRRITETKQPTSAVLDSSRMVQYLINFLKRWKNKITRYLRTSLAIILAKDTKKELYLSPMMIISIIMVILIVTNVLLSLVLHKQIGIWGWLMRGLFLFVAVLGLFCKADWPTVKKSSAFLRMIRMD